MAKLRAKDIVRHALLWYSGFSSRGSWNCPAIITRVDVKRARFRVMSLDDMTEQDMWYPFDEKDCKDNSRTSMQTTTQKAVLAYLGQQQRILEGEVCSSKQQLADDRRALTTFKKWRACYGLI